MFIAGMGEPQNFGHIYLSRRYTILFYTLLFTMVASPVIAALRMSGTVLDLLLAVGLLAAVMPLDPINPKTLLFMAMSIALLARPVAAWFGLKTLSVMTLWAWTLIGLLAAAAALRFAMRGSKVDAEHLFAALSAYLLAGIYFGLLYWALEQLQPGMFTASDFSRSGAIYFSFVTLATLGYGDIVPHSEIARGLAVVEAVGGQLFLAVLVARLLSLYSRSAKD